MKSIKRILLCICALFTLGSATGVYAFWQYFHPADAQVVGMGIHLREFEWAPEVILPEDSGHQQDHYEVVDEILMNDKIGLLVKSTLNENVESKGELHYCDHVTSGNLKHFQGIIQDSKGARSLGFVMMRLEVVDGELTKFYCYTFMRLTGEAEEGVAPEDIIQDGDLVEVYRTLFVANTDPSYDVDNNGRTDSWAAVSSIRGYAEVVKTRDNLSYGEFTIDPSTWQTANAGEEIKI
ncbi:MAG: hypothetical protein IJX75_04080 [Clostridia bacterium]|nr:hypothetical protein [Clostridia bacterium]